MNTISKINEKFSLKQVLATSLLMVTLPLASVVIAHDDDKGPNTTSHEMHKGTHCERGNRMQRDGMGKLGIPPYLQGLQLSATQEDQIFALTYPQIPTMRNQHKQRMQLMEELRAASQTDKFDEAKVQQLADKMASLEKEKIMTHARNNAKIFAILTPEQRTKVREHKMHRPGFGHDFGPRADHDTERSGADSAGFTQSASSPLVQRLI